MRILTALILLLMPVMAQAQTFGAEQMTLKNGMQIVVIPNHRAPVITHMVWYKVGAAEEEPGKSGMAHYLEHLLFKGTATMAPGEFSKTIKTLGGNDNAFTGQDYTAFFETVSVGHLKKVMEMEADRMMGANPPEEHFKSEKNVVLEERRQRTDNEPRAIFAEQMNTALYANHPYSIPVIGWMDEIKLYDWKDVQAFYQKWYAPNNAILVISGDVTLEQIKPQVENIFGPLPTKKLKKRERPQIAPANGQTVMTLQDASIHQPAWQRIYIAPSESRNRSDSLALQVLAEIMDGGPTTRLYKRLVVDQKVATGIQFNYNSTALDYGSISLAATPSDGKNVSDIEGAINAEIQDVLTNGVSDEEVKEAVQRLQDDAVFARDSLAGPAMIFGAALTTGSTVEEVESWSTDIAAITPAQIKDAANRYLNPAAPWIRPPVTGHLLPAAAPVAAPAQKEEAIDAR